MKEKNKRLIKDVLIELGERDPEWKKNKMLPKFKVLFNGWRNYELKHHFRAHLFYYESWKRGWMPKGDFERFRKYALQ